MAAASCDDAPEEPTMQANSQEPILANGDIAGSVTGVLAAGQTVDLNTAGSQIQLFSFSKAEGLPDGATLLPVLQLSDSQSFEKMVSIDMALGYDGETYTVTDDEWNAAHVELFGKNPTKVRTAYYRIPVYVVWSDTEYRYNSPDWYAATGTVNEISMSLGYTIYDAYYFLSGATTWDIADANIENYRFEHSEEDVYDDPVFTLRIDIPEDALDAAEGGCYWQIATGSNSGVYGPEFDGDEESSGYLVEGVSAQRGLLTAAGKYDVTINMETRTYEIAMVMRPDYIAVASNANGWSTKDGALLYWSNKDDKPYFCGAARVNNNDGGYKFVWDDSWYGGADGVIDPNGGNIPAPKDENALYWFTVSTDDMTYTIEEVTAIGVIGDMNSWGAMEPLLPDADMLVWSGDVNLTGSWKIIFNEQDWKKNYGGPDLTDPTFDGDNITGYEGLHTVTIDFSGNHPVITVAAK